MTHPTRRKRRAGAEDMEIGRKIRALRLQRGLSQSGLADGIGLTFQQVQKYEKGTNRVSAGRLHKIADILDVPMTFFYSGMGVRTKKQDTATLVLPLSRPRAPGDSALLCGYPIAKHEVCARGHSGSPSQEREGLGRPHLHCAREGSATRSFG